MSGGKVHYDASKVGDVLSTSWCGLLGYETSEDESRVNCRRCRAMRQTKAEPAPPRAPKPKAEAETALDRTIRTLLKPKADAPPVLTSQEYEDDKRTVWQLSCKGAEGGRCHTCAICSWEKDAERWEYAAPDRHESARIKAEPNAARPRWSSMSAAFIDLVEFERHNRFAPSATGGLLARIARGADTDGGKSRPDDPMLHKAGELVVLRKALERAYPDGAHALPAPLCRGLLVIRTPGVMISRPSYEELSAELGMTEGVLQALVRSGRDKVELDLFERGVIPRPRQWSRVRDGGAVALASVDHMEQQEGEMADVQQ